MAEAARLGREYAHWVAPRACIALPPSCQNQIPQHRRTRHPATSNEDPPEIMNKTFLSRLLTFAHIIMDAVLSYRIYFGDNELGMNSEFQVGTSTNIKDVRSIT